MPNQPNPVTAVDEHIHLVKQDAVGVLFGEALEGDEVHARGLYRILRKRGAIPCGMVGDAKND
jgi:hypothetical protein